MPYSTDLFFCFFSLSLSVFLSFGGGGEGGLSLAGNSGRFTRVRQGSRKSSATHFYPGVWHFCVSEQCSMAASVWDS